MTAAVTDKQLVQRVQRGDKHAFDLLVVKYQHKIMSLISRYVKDADEVQDVAQEAFIKAFRALPKFRGDSAKWDDTQPQAPKTSPWRLTR